MPTGEGIGAFDREKPYTYASGLHAGPDIIVLFLLKGIEIGTELFSAIWHLYHGEKQPSTA